ncbi:MAG TPA: cation:proton antiporter, partial [Thermoanaerobaculia bacterium]|nr:cation:proton antiporter [Thermoanaerobaculia bacterium]
IDAHDPMLHVLSELGVLLLLFLIGLETDIKRLLSVGGASLAVAAAGVTLPFAAGYGVSIWLNYPTTVAVGPWGSELQLRLSMNCWCLNSLATRK